MPGEEAPGLSSVRIQRALRLNGIEDGRLQQCVRVLDSDRHRTMRLLRQDIRLVSMTLDFIHTSSGISIEGLAPCVSLREERAELAPSMEYGETVTARRHDAIQKGGAAAAERGQNAAGGPSAISRRYPNALRPQSSPNVGRPPDESRPRTRIRTATGAIGRHAEDPDVDAPRSGAAVGNFGRKGVFRKNVRRALGKSAPESGISDVVLAVVQRNRRDETEQRKASGQDSPTKRQNVLDLKKAIQTTNQEKLDLKIRSFLEKISPTKESALYRT